MVDLRRVEWVRRLEEGMDIFDEMGMIDGLAYVLCMDKGVLLPRSSALG